VSPAPGGLKETIINGIMIRANDVLDTMIVEHTFEQLCLDLALEHKYLLKSA
jgi:hypothetical protein